jgi:NADH dehydrogenase
MSKNPREILILGAGFGGVYTARYLGKMLKPDEGRVSIVNRDNYWVYQPLLPEVVSGNIGLTDTVAPIRRLCPRASLIMRDVEEIDLKNRVVTLSPGFRPKRTEIHYDQLVIALGNVTNFLGMPGLQEHALPFRMLGDAVLLRNHVIHTLEEADFESNAELRRKLLTFVVAGGGFSGVEVIAEINDFVRAVARNYPRIPPQEIRCVLVHAGPRILPEMVEGLGLFAEKILRKRGVEILLNDRLEAATSEKAKLKSGKEIPTKTIVSTVPSALPQVLDQLDVPKERGRLLTNAHMELAGYEGEVWVVGDCGAIKTAAGNPAPPTAQHAIREAKTAAHNITAVIRKTERTVFTFEGLGKLGSLGHRSAVADIFGIHISGFFAWALWRAIYLFKMPGMNTKVHILIDWLLDLLFPPDLVQLRVSGISGIHREHFQPGEVVFNQGDVGDSVFAIQDGECEVVRETDGKSEVLAVLGPATFFGEMAVLGDCTRNATIRARTPVRVLSMSKSDFNKIRETVPAFANVFSDLAKDRSGVVKPGERKASQAIGS